MINQYLKTLKSIFQSPKKVIDSFIETNESAYTHPFKFMLMGAIPFIILCTVFIDFSLTADSIAPASENQLSHWIEVTTIRLSTQFLSFTLFLSVPLLSIPAIFFLRNELEGFYSHLILNSYAIGASMVVILALIPLWIILKIPLSDPFLYSTLPSLFVGLSIIWIYTRYFSVQKLIGWIRTLSSLICGYLLYIMIKGLFAAVLGFMIFAVKRLTELGGI